MESRLIDITPVALSVWVYRMLLKTYPVRFQREYGAHMLQVFRDCCLRAFHEGRTNGMLKLWVITLFDLIQSVVSEHSHKEIEMKKEMKPQDIRMAGWALMLGSVVFSLGIFAVAQADWYIAIALVALISMPLLAFGLLGLRRRYGDRVGGIGKNILLIGAVLGSLISIIGYFGEVGLFGRGAYSYWHLIFSGPTVLFACLALFGVIALFKKPLPRWNAAPILAGVWYPFLLITSNTIQWAENIGILGVILTIQCIPLIALGYILKSDVPEKTMVAV